MAKQLRLDVAQLTDVGRKREHNEDNMAYVIPKDLQVMTKKGALFIVADGMGGHAAGEVASEIAVDTVSNVYYQDDSEDVAACLMHAIKRANASIHQRAQENMLRSGMGTTCVAGVFRGNVVYIANVGDSRAYLVRGNVVKQISQDHSWVAEQVRAGLLTEEQARTHGQRNVITRSLGTQTDVDIDLFYEQLEAGDSLVLCTDGLSGLVNDEEIQRIVNQYVPQESVYHLVERANENGGPDNITAIVVRVQEVGVEPPNARHPVRVGGRENGENTVILEKLPSGPMTPVMGNAARSPSGPLWLPGSSLSPPESITTAPQPVVAAPQRKQNRLLYPTLAVVVLLLLAVIGTGIYSFLAARTGANTEQALQQAETLITRADREIATKPAFALQDLAMAQNLLRMAQKESPTSTQSTRMSTLQTKLTTEVKAAIVSYNQQALITLLPCANTPVTPLHGDAAHSQAVAFTQATDLKGNVVRYAQGQDMNLYQLDAQNNLSTRQPLTSGEQVLAIAGDGSRLFYLSQVKANPPTSYKLTQLTPGQTGAKAKTIQTTGDQVPKLLTAWGSDIYVVLLSSSTSTTVMIQDYTADKLSEGPKSRSISVSNLVSVAAFPNHLLFLLSADGTVRSLQFDNPGQAPPVPVFVQSAIASPLSVSAEEFSPAKDVPKVRDVTASRNIALVLPGTMLLAAGTINGVSSGPHLYLVDPLTHRLLDLARVPSAAPAPGTPTATSSAGGGTAVSSPAATTVMLSLLAQYVSGSLFVQVKGLSVDPKGASISVLTEQGTPSMSNLVSIKTSQKNVCGNS